ncbi:MAG: hypothetical protein IJJ60_03495, partial [Clostridia bacterium]|nr:hypothetical protein [Clostridia bacterium]
MLKILLYRPPEWISSLWVPCSVIFPLMTTYAIDHFIPNLDHPGGMEGAPGFIAAYGAVLLIQVATIFYFL